VAVFLDLSPNECSDPCAVGVVFGAAADAQGFVGGPTAAVETRPAHGFRGFGGGRTVPGLAIFGETRGGGLLAPILDMRLSFTWSRPCAAGRQASS